MSESEAVLSTVRLAVKPSVLHCVAPQLECTLSPDLDGIGTLIVHSLWIYALPAHSSSCLLTNCLVEQLSQFYGPATLFPN